MNILLLITQLEAAGTQKAACALAQGLQRQAHQARIAALYDKTGIATHLAEAYGVPVIDLHMCSPGMQTRQVSLWRFCRGISRLRRLLHDGSVDILQTFTHYSNVIGPLVARSVGTPICVVSQRNSPREIPPIVRVLYRMIAKSPAVSHITVVSEKTRDSVLALGLSPSKISVIRNGLDSEHRCLFEPRPHTNTLRSELGIPKHARLVATVARLSEQKGHCILLEAIQELERFLPEVYFLLVGDGPMRSSLQREANFLGLTRVRFLGVRHDVERILRESELFVLPSLWEGLPNAILEAMNAGLPVVTTYVDGCIEAVVDGESGMAVPPGNPKALADAILTLCQNPGLRSSMGLAGRRRVRRYFRQEDTTRAYLNLYKQLLGGTSHHVYRQDSDNLRYC